MKLFHKLKNFSLSVMLRLFPVQKNTVLFSSFFGLYNDNPKAVSEALHELYPDVNIVWVKSPASNEDVPSYCQTVRYGSASYYKLASCAQVVVDNMRGIRETMYTKSKNPFANFANSLSTKAYCAKRKGQYNISTWHGTPLKKLGAEEQQQHSESYVLHGSSDSLTAGCTHTQICLQSAYPGIAPIKLHGTPRNDILFKKNVDITALKQKLHLPLDKKIILFAPTFRVDVAASGVSQMEQINFDLLFTCLKKKFNGEWCFVFRVHQFVLLNIDVDSLTQKYGSRFIVGNIGDDMAEYLMCTDILLTDYSSSMFDFALTKRPCFLFALDREHYEKVERGFYLDYDALPFPRAYTSDELIEQIEKFDNKDYCEKVDQFLIDIGNVEDGHATERIVNDIIHFIETGEKR